MPLNKGLIQVYTGQGKGKTTAALGLALRAAGQGLRVYIAQFMKGQPHSGELTALKKQPNITLRQFGRAGFVDPKNPAPEDIELARKGLAQSRHEIHSGRYDLVILDELNLVTSWGLVELEEVLSLIKEKPQGIELVLTGREAPPEVIALADLVTEMVEVKHPFQEGIASRRGIDY